MTVQDAKPGGAREIVVFSILRPSVCADCRDPLEQGDFVRMEKDRPVCMVCADLGHLVFLPRGDTALTRRSRQSSRLSAVVVRFSRARGRYERQGLLVEAAALERAEAECLNDRDARRAARERAAAYREKLDEGYLADFTHAIRVRFPGCPAREAAAIARHACLKRSGRIGRSAGAKHLDPVAVELAVRAHVRHEHTSYDRMLAEGESRQEARAAVAAATADVMEAWSRRAAE